MHFFKFQDGHHIDGFYGNQTFFKVVGSRKRQILNVSYIFSLAQDHEVIKYVKVKKKKR